MDNHSSSAHAGHMPTSGRGTTVFASLTGIHFVIEMTISLRKIEYDFFFSTVQIEQICLDELDAEPIDITPQVTGRGSQ